MRLAMAQLDQRVGDPGANAAAILDAVAAGRRAGVDLVVTPELSLCGYLPDDLLLRPAFIDACARELAALAGATGDLAVVVGFPEKADGALYDAAAVLRAGKVERVYRKQALPNYTVFDEARYFTPGREPCVFACGGVAVGLVICEDAWRPQPVAQARAAGAQCVIVANGSPYHTRQQEERRRIVQARARESGVAIVYVNRVGGQDELVFDGASFVVDATGALAQQLPAWHEALAIAQIDGGQPRSVRGTLAGGLEAHVYEALVMGVRDYVDKNGFPGAIVGLSGGVDSALTLAIAVDALGRGRVRSVMLPSRFNAAMSLEDARTMAAIHGVRHDEIAIDDIVSSFDTALAREFHGLPKDAAEENIQARVRGTLLMALANKHGAIVLATGNKSEMAVGYATLYGDMAGGFAALKDVSKTMVYRLCAYRNRLGGVIPGRVLARPPSAELREGQRDQDTLPPYDVLDAILEAYVERDQSPRDIVAAGWPAAAVDEVVRLVRRNEHKRRQAAIGIRITPRAFGKDWRVPVTSGFV
jgi:NAD+ synthetase